MNSLQEYYAASLAKYGGFSHKAIAAKVFNSTPTRVSFDHVRETQNVLRKNKIRVTDWRNMLSAEAKAAADAMRDKTIKKNTRKRRRAG